MATNKNKDINIKGVLNSLEEDTDESIHQTGDKTNLNIDTSNEGKTNTDNNVKYDTNDNINDDTKSSTAHKFVIKKKVDDKKGKKAFNVYMPDSLVKELDKLSKKTGYSRNELINMMCQDCLKNYEIVEE